MPGSLELRQQLQQSIKDDIARRTAAHQAKVARLRTGQKALLAAGAPAAAEPLILLALGDSWFDYPLVGNGPLPGNTDIATQLEGMGAINPLINNVSHFGDATTDELALPKQQRMIEALNDPDNWGLSKLPDAILFSGAGNDIAGDRFCIYLDYNTPGSTGLDAVRFSGVLASIKASILDLISFRDQYAPNVPIFMHDYDFPTPNGAHPICAGPWLQPSLIFRGWTDVAQGAAIIKTALLQFQALVTSLTTPGNRVFLVGTQGTLSPSDWANELHPTPDGFKRLAAKFVAALATQFPGRI